jgi:hypothetical protein
VREVGQGAEVLGDPHLQGVTLPCRRQVHDVG